MKTRAIAAPNQTETAQIAPEKAGTGNGDSSPGAVASRTEIATAASIARAAAILQRGGLVAFPTETVYGLGADAASDKAVAAIFAAKQRPQFNPLIVHVRDLEHAQTLAIVTDHARLLAKAFWPGPLTLVLPRREGACVSFLASAGLDTIAVRVPAHSTARQLLQKSGLAIAAPSANRSGKVSPTIASHVAESLGAAVELILDAGAAPLGLESTIVGFGARGPTLLRTGALPRDNIEAVIGPLFQPTTGGIVSPGMLRTHYAPHAKLRLEAREVRSDEALLAFGSDVPAGALALRNLSPSGDLIEAAANLFAMLRELDATGSACIAVMPVPGHALGEAINDRLRRAAAPREG